MKIIGKFWCWLLRKVGYPHDWRRAHKDERCEPLDFLICRRCNADRKVNHRVKQEAT